MRSYHKISVTCLITIAFILFSYTFSFAQLESIKGVQFKDGSIIYGRVIKMNVYNVEIQTTDGKIISCKFDDVVNFLKDTDIEKKKDDTQEAKQSQAVEKISKTEVLKEEVLKSEKIQDEKESPKTLSKARHTWEIGPEISYIEYKEPAVMSQKGPMYGIGAAYSYHNGVMIQVAGRYSYGRVDYQNSGTLNNIDDSIFEIRTIGGYDFKISSSFTMTPFIGLGYRYLKDDSAGRITSTGAKGYLRESNYYYSPIGIEAVNVFNNGWSAGVILEYDYFWKGRQKSYASDVLAGLNDVENNQNSGYGVRGSIIIKKQADRVFYVIEPFIRYWNIDKSDVQNVTYKGSYTGVLGWEPKNESTEIGVKFMLGF